MNYLDDLTFGSAKPIREAVQQSISFTGNRREPRILIGCEFSQTVMSAWFDRGFDVYSCDLLPCEGDYPERHYQCDIREILDGVDGEKWDLIIIAHPPCTRLTNSGVRWLSKPATNPVADCTDAEREAWPTLSDDEKLAITWKHLDDGAALFSDLWNADCPRIVLENPVMHKHAKARIKNYVEFAQSVQPWQFGHNETKRTCFWIKGLPNLVPDTTVKPDNVEARVHSLPPSKDRWKLRSAFFSGIADAMALQWGPIIEKEISLNY